MNKFGEKLKQFITSDEEYDDEEEVVEDVNATSEYEKANQKGVLKVEAKMMIFEPRSYDDATTIAEADAFPGQQFEFLAVD